MSKKHDTFCCLNGGEKMLGLDRSIVEVVDYDPSWKNEFEKEAKRLSEPLKEYAIEIRHVGSTSIVGLPAKPIIDIAVVVKDESAMLACMEILKECGYEVKNKIEEKGEIFGKLLHDGVYTHNMHVEIYGSENWDNHVLFQRYLNEHPEYIKQYAELKINNAKLYRNERKKYTLAKDAFVKNVLALAKKEYKN